MAALRRLRSLCPCGVAVFSALAVACAHLLILVAGCGQFPIVADLRADNGVSLIAPVQELPPPDPVPTQVAAANAGSIEPTPFRQPASPQPEAPYRLISTIWAELAEGAPAASGPVVFDSVEPCQYGSSKPANGNDKEPDKKDEANGNGADKKDQDDKDKERKWKLLPTGWNFHAQTTLIPEFDAGFPSKYSGPNSLDSSAQRAGTLSADLYLGAPLWHGAEFHADLLTWQGFGLSNTFGLNSDPNGDAYKAGTSINRFMFAHFFIRQTIGLGGEQEDVPDGPLTLPGKQDVTRLTITAGRMSVMDIFDRNTYDHDVHTQFMNWSNIQIAWDYPSDTVGYTTGIAIELNQRDWSVRYGWFQMPSTPNGFTSDDRIFMWPIVEPSDGPTSDGEFWKQWGMILEPEYRWRIEDHPGAIRIQAWLQHGRWASYNAATALLIANPPDPNGPQGVQVNVPQAAFGYHWKYGIGLNWEQEIRKNLGMFARLSVNDGHSAAATYNDAAWGALLGASVKGAAWCRPGDTFGLAGVVNGIYGAEQDFLKAGGLGISTGDGNLTYGPETIMETYYSIAIAKNTYLTIDYQFVFNPSFNRDRGPVNVFLGRLHWEF